MGVVVHYGRKKAFLRDGVWRSSDSALESRLNALTQDWVLSTGGPKLNEPDPELTAAKRIAEATGGRVVLHVQARPKIERQVWASRRQYALPFFNTSD